MWQIFANVAGVVSAGLILMASFDLIRTIYRGERPAPHPLPWMIRLSPHGFVLVAQLVEGAEASLALQAAMLACGLIIVVLAFWRGNWPRAQWGIREGLAIGLAVVGLLGWWLIGAPVVAILCGVSVHLVANTLHAVSIVGGKYVVPPEPPLFWWLSLVAAAAAVVAVGQTNWVLYIAPVASMLSCSIVLVGIRVHQARQSRAVLQTRFS